MLNWPPSLVTAVRFTLVPTSVMVTLALPITAPLGSVTVPVMAAFPPPCPKAPAAINSIMPQSPASFFIEPPTVHRDGLMQWPRFASGNRTLHPQNPIEADGNRLPRRPPFVIGPESQKVPCPLFPRGNDP